MAKKRVKKRKVKSKRIVILIFVIIIFVLVMGYLYNLKIKTITVSGNTLYSEWEIIKLAKLNNYPSSMQNMAGLIEHRLTKDPYIKKAKVHKKFLTTVHIEIEENLPLFYSAIDKKTVLIDGTKTTINFPVPTLINYVPNKIYEDFIKEMANTKYEIIKRISEIKYDPNEVDDERFLFTMTDGNYAYLTLSKFNKINHYVEIIKEFNNKKGILYLDSGEYFKVIN